MLYWIEYTDGTTSTFAADNPQEARHYFQMEGDHAFDFGPVDKPEFPPAVSGWMETVDKEEFEGKAIHRTRKGKGVVGQAIAKHKQPPNCS